MDNRIGLHVNYFRGTPYEYDMFAAARCISSAGGSVIEMMPAHLFHYTHDERLRLRNLLARLDMELIVGAGRTPETNASSPDPAVREASFDASVRIMSLLAELGCHKWDGLIHAAWPESPDGVLTPEKKEEILARSAAEMRRILPIAEELDIDLCFELVNRFEHYLLNTVDEGVAFCRRFDSPRAKLLIDVFHMNIEEDGLPAAISAAADSGFLRHVHICEANRSMPGTVPTHLDWNGIFDALVRAGYKDSIVLEPFVVGGAEFSNVSAIWRDQTHGGGFDWMLKAVETGISFAKSGLAAAEARVNK